jgi:hypothetical protein
MADALVRVVGPTTRDSGAKVLPSLMALIWVETGRGQKMFNFNVGNVSASDAYNGDVWRPSWFELSESSSSSDKQLHARMLKGEAPSGFRAYQSLDEGLRDLLRLLSSTRYARLSELMATDDDGAIVAELNRSGYSKDYGPAHVATFQALRAELTPLFPSAEGLDWKPPAKLVGSILLVGGALLLAASQGKAFSRFGELFRVARS